ncbi:uncharacterized protein TNCV_2057561 [Trichonephila clavipes]|nr:uncharacterized protein TNCV_2057561 [Trichonephila clavipes]
MSVLSQPAYFAHANVFHHEGKPVPIELSIATIPRDDSDPEVMCITVNHAGQPSKPKDVRSNCQENARLRLVHHPLPKSVPVEYLSFCVRGKFSQLARGNRGLMVVKGLEQQKNFQELGLYAMALENLPKFKDICDGTFPDPEHEGVHEEEDISYCTMLKSYQFAKYLQQFNKLHAEWSYKLSVLTHIPEDGTEPKVICITVDHSNLLTTDKDSRANRYINERLSLKSHLPGSVPLKYLDFCVRGKFCHLAQGNRGLIVVKGSDQRKFFEKLGLFTINLEILPHFRDLNDCSLPDHLHDDVHEGFDISECTMVKSYRFARYLQHFNKLQAECKRQTAHLVDDDTKYSALVANLDAETLSYVSDIVLSLPNSDKYHTLSQRLITQFTDSETQKIKKLLTDLQLGDEKPSHLLRKMKELSNGQLQDDFLQSLWIQRMPPHIQTVLSASSEPLDKLAIIADKVSEVVGASSTTCAATTIPPPSQSSSCSVQPTMDSLVRQIQELSLQVAELTRERNSSRHQ